MLPFIQWAAQISIHGIGEPAIAGFRKACLSIPNKLQSDLD
jgi:hypothetical protein